MVNTDLSAISSISTVPSPSIPNIPPGETARGVRGTERYIHPDVLATTTIPASIGRRSEEKVKDSMVSST